MRRFYIIANYDKEYVLEAETFIRSYLEGKGAQCTVQPAFPQDCLNRHTESAMVPPEVQCVITIGGDGTLIQAARDLAGRDIPMVGVNRGHLGFLNQISRQEDIAPVMDALLEDRYQLESRMMIQGEAVRDGQTVMCDIALNEIAVTRPDA